MISQTFVVNHVKSLLQMGYAVQIYCFESGFAASGIEDQENLKKLVRAPLSISGSGFFASLARVFRLLRSPIKLLRAMLLWPSAIWRRQLLFASSGVVEPGQFDLCHVHFAGDGDAVAALRAAGFVSCPLVVSVHGYDINEDVDGMRPRYDFLFGQADAIIATTAFMADATAELGCPRPLIHVMPSGIDIERFKFEPRSHVPGTTLHLMSVARLMEVKGIEFAIRAVAMLKESGLDVRYSIVGDGPLRDELENLVRELDLAGIVTFHGAQPTESVVRLYACHHVFLFPSCTSSSGAREGQGIVALEAQACGLMVVASRTGGIPEVIQDGRTGILVPEKNPEAIAAAVRQLLDRHAEWPGIGRTARNWVEQNFSREAYASGTDRLYRALLAQGSRPTGN